jgi:Transposase
MSRETLIDLTGEICTKWNERESTWRKSWSCQSRGTNQSKIVTMLRQIEVSIANGKTTPQACKEAEITVQTFYRWRKEYGGLKMDQAKRLKELEKENGNPAGSSTSRHQQDKYAGTLSGIRSRL